MRENSALAVIPGKSFNELRLLQRSRYARCRMQGSEGAFSKESWEVKQDFQNIGPHLFAYEVPYSWFVVFQTRINGRVCPL
jgi:hypothetical protein